MVYRTGQDVPWQEAKMLASLLTVDTEKDGPDVQKIQPYRQ